MEFDETYFANKGLYRLWTEDSWGSRITYMQDRNFKTLKEAKVKMLQELLEGFKDHVINFGEGNFRRSYIVRGYIFDDKGLVKTMDISHFEKKKQKTGLKK